MPEAPPERGARPAVVLSPQIAGQYISRHALDHRIPPRESGDPFAASGVEHLAPAAGEVDDHPGATFDSVHGRVAAVSEPDLGHVLRIVVGEEPIIERYARRTGIDPSDIDWYQAFAYFKLAVVCQGIAARAAGGSMVGGGFDQAERLVAPLVEAGRQQLSS